MLLSFGVLMGGGVLVDRLGAGQLQRWVLVALSAFLLIFSGLSAFWATPAVGVTGLILISLADPLISLAAMPLLMAYCRPKIEGSQFTTYMALVNLCTVAASYLNGWLLQLTTAPVIGFGCGIVLVGLVAAIYRYRPAPPLVEAI
ncbi:MAG: hypothetical protein EOO56_16635 [Hymenobacter sp.]|nr:MAG: hypothetical protein EOO56_16635 [Hymenobacter sp.]